MRRSFGWFGLAVAVLLGAAVSGSAQWKPTAMPDGGYVFSLAAVDTTLFAGTENGVFKSSDYGAHWLAVGFSDTSVRRVVGTGGVLFADVAGKAMRSSDLGATWTSKGPDDRSTVLLGSSLDLLWASAYILGTNSRALYFSSDQGEHWQLASGAAGALTVSEYAYAIAADTRHIFLATGDGVSISERNDSGYTPWNAVLVGGIYGTCGVHVFIYQDTVLYGGSWGLGLVRSEDLATFQQRPNGGLTSPDIHTLLTYGSSLFAGTRYGIFRSNDWGSQWTAVGLQNTNVYSLIQVGSHLFAGAASGVSRSDDGGVTWTDVHTGLQGKGAFCLVTQGDSLLLGTRSGLFRSTDQGASWTSLGLNDEYVYTVVQDGSDLYAGTVNNLYRSNDNGLTWSCLTTGLYQSTYSLIVTPTVILKAGYFSNGVWRSTDHGATWTHCDNTPSFQVRFAQVGTTSVASCQGVYLSPDEGANWNFDWNNAMSLRLIWDLAVRGNDLYAASGRQVYVSSDEGLTWTNVSTGLPGGQVEELTLNGTDLYASTDNGIAVLPEHASVWTQVNMDGLENARIGPMAVTSSNFLVIAGPWGEVIENYREVWTRPIDQVLCCSGSTGNVNMNGVVDLSDLSTLVNYLTGGGYTLACPASANVNGSGIIDLGDLSAMVSYLTGGGYALPACQ